MAYERIDWINDKYPAIDAYNLNHIEYGIANAVSRSGDTMNGKLFLNGRMTEDNEAVTKKYVIDFIKEYIDNLTPYALSVLRN